MNAPLPTIFTGAMLVIALACDHRNSPKQPFTRASCLATHKIDARVCAVLDEKSNTGDVKNLAIDVAYKTRVDTASAKEVLAVTFTDAHHNDHTVYLDSVKVTDTPEGRAAFGERLLEILNTTGVEYVKNQFPFEMK